MIERRADNSEMCGLIPLEATRYANYSVVREVFAKEFLTGSTPVIRSKYPHRGNTGPAPSKRTQSGSTPLENSNLSRPADGTLPPMQNIESSNLSRDSTCVSRSIGRSRKLKISESDGSTLI